MAQNFYRAPHCKYAMYAGSAVTVRLSLRLFVTAVVYIETIKTSSAMLNLFSYLLLFLFVLIPWR